MKMRPTFLQIAILSCLSPLLPDLASGQAGIASEREAIISYSEEELNPVKPGYEWEGATLLQDIRVIDGLGNPPQNSLDLLVINGKIQSFGKT